MSSSMSVKRTSPPPNRPALPPEGISAYVKLTRLHMWPLGNILVFWPCAWGLLMAALNNPISSRDLFIGTIGYGIGATLAHSMSCILNDICDKEFDGKVERTKNRPLVTGEVSLRGAWLLLFACLQATMSMFLFINKKAATWGLFGIFMLHSTYPLMKRWTWWPQVYLGLGINWGFFVGWFSITVVPEDMCPIYAMFASLVCWTIYYDTIYACQDRVDDVSAGIKSTAVLFGSRVRVILPAFAVAFLSLMALAGYLNHNGIWFFVVSCGGAACHIAWQLMTWNEHDNTDCAVKFKSNGDMGYIVWIGLFLDYVSHNWHFLRPNII